MHFSIIRGKYPLSIHAIWIFIVIFLFLLYKFLPPSQCLFHEIAGFPCLSCGATRAAAAFLAGDFLAMIYYNPLLVLFSAGLIFFSLFKFSEYILKFQIKLRLNRNTAFAIRILAVFSIAANWLFLIVSGR